MIPRLPCLYLVYHNYHNLCLELIECFFISEPRIVHFISNDHFSFSVVLNKNKSMGNCISRINKYHFFVIKEFIKNYVLFSNGMTRLALEWGTKKTYTGVHSIRKFSKTLAPLKTVFQGSIKTIFFVIEEFMKNYVLFSNGATRLPLEWGTKKIYTGFIL